MKAHTLDQTLAFVRATLALNKCEPASEEWKTAYRLMWIDFPIFMQRAGTKKPEEMALFRRVRIAS